MVIGDLEMAQVKHRRPGNVIYTRYTLLRIAHTLVVRCFRVKINDTVGLAVTNDIFAQMLKMIQINFYLQTATHP